MSNGERLTALASLLLAARWYVNDSLEAHEHSDGRDLLTRIDAALEERVTPTASARCPICEKNTPHAHGPEVVKTWRDTIETRARQAFSDGAFAVGVAYHIDDPAVEHVIKQAYDPGAYALRHPFGSDRAA